MAIDLSADLVELTRAVIDAPSQSLHEEDLADAIEDALCRCSHLEIERLGNSLVARTQLGRAERVVIAGHIDTVPENANLPSSVRGEDVWGLGSCDMKGGLSIALKLAHDVSAPCRDVTWVFYEAEEIAAIHNGLGKLARERPELLEADFAILMEPSDAGVEAGCQGTLRVFVQAHGERSHSARAWMGTNAIHSLAPALDALANYTPRDVDIDGLVYREGLNAVGISGGVAGNVIPDAAQIVVNFL
jgi:succinyl-diaminopimelate desuccinylase